ncbi:3-dehydroquinate synthase [Zhaonella formicivorans]|uniref:3-dehydroquinate synthase n=1 Tax=Zhaonella formicivorans TaxID=2528593 RepID=UPI0010F0E1E4|nr:3-dehydroquinate synthase [Zhaonella formicivorans]
MQKVKVDLAERSYWIIAGRELLDGLGKMLLDLKVGKKCLVVSNKTVFGHYGEQVVNSLKQEGFAPEVALVEDGENAKSLDWAAKLYDKAVEARLDRTSPVIALGGGVIGDLAGFIAATFMRGVPLVQIPTTLLAQVDSSVGGKVAINHPKGKNLIGAFYQPRLVVADLTTLTTLPAREIRAGMAEVIKYGVIWDACFFEYLEQEGKNAMEMDYEVLQNIVVKSCSIKAQVVGRDERENNLRAILNYGHTIGHALETLTDYNFYSHGQAVAIGMAVAAEMAVKMGLIAEEMGRRITRLLAACGLPVTLPADFAPEAIVNCILLDKKNKQGLVSFILPEAIGKVGIYQFSPEQVLQYLKER